MKSDVLESDPFFTLLTDALRAGPGSPEWHQAVAKLRGDGANGSDDYKLLQAARENLESGRDYRAVRAGPGFTSRLLTRLDDETGHRGGLPTANLVMIFSALAILAVLGGVAYLLSRGGGGKPRATEAPNLATMYFPNDAAVATFNGDVPPGWREIGRLPLHNDGSLRPQIVPMAVGDYIGGGVVTAQPLPAGEPFAMEAVVTVPETPGDFLAEVFVSDSADFSEFRATAPSELVWLLRGADQKVMVKGQSQGRVETLKQFDQPITVRVVVDGDRALVETRRDEQSTTLWSGAHGLAPDKPRYAGVRFIRGSGGGEDVATVRSMRVLTRGAGPAGVAAGAGGSGGGAGGR
jgi:hypothetical protein